MQQPFHIDVEKALEERSIELCMRPERETINMGNIKRTDKKDKKMVFIIILILLLIVAAGLIIWLALRETPTAILTDTNEATQDVDATNELRIKMNTTITVDNGTMQNLNFENLNEGRDLQCRIMLEETGEYVYKSQKLKTGKMIQADVINEAKLKNGENPAIAEVHAFNMDGEETNQTNVKITLVK